MDKTSEVKAVIFDMDGVIFDSERTSLVIWEENARKIGMTDVEKVFRMCIGTTRVRTAEIIEEYYSKKHGAGIAKEIMEANSRLFHERYDHGRLPVMPYVRELLDYLKEQRIKIGLASSTRKATIVDELTDAKLIDYFDQITGGDQCKNSKPAPDIYLSACHDIGVEAHEAFAVEDSYNGIRSAHAAGMRPVMVPDMVDADDEMRELSEVICKDLSEVKEYISYQI